MLLELATCERVHCFHRLYVPARPHESSRSPRRGVVEVCTRPRPPAVRVGAQLGLCIDVQAKRASKPASSGQSRLRRLLEPGEPASAAEVVEGLGFWERPRPAAPRPHVLLNMTSTLDGRATLSGRSGPLSGPADRELFHALRAPMDCVLAGAATVRMERYGRLIPDERVRIERSARGLPEEPLACVVSGRLTLEPDIPLLREPAARVAIVTASHAALQGARAQVEYVRAVRDGAVDLAVALAQLRERFGVELVLCEGGPHLAQQMLAAGLLDELFLALSPKIAGGEASGGEALRIIAGPELAQPASLSLLAALESESHLFLRYRVLAS